MPLAQRRPTVRSFGWVASASYGVGHLLGIGAAWRCLALTPVLATDCLEPIRHYVMEENAVGDWIPIGLNPHRQGGRAYRPIAEVDLPYGQLLLGQMRG